MKPGAGPISVLKDFVLAVFRTGCRSPASLGAGFAAGLLSLTVCGGAEAQAVGACAWSRADPGAKTVFLEAYRRGGRQANAALAAMDPDLRQAFAGCAYRSDVPGLWVEKDLVAEAIKDGAAEILADRGVVRPELTAAWSQAPDKARNCIMANAAKVFSIPAPACQDPHAPGWFLQQFHVGAGDKEEATQLLYYFNASAQSEWAEALIQEFEARVPPAPVLAPQPGAARPPSPDQNPPQPNAGP